MTLVSRPHVLGSSLLAVLFVVACSREPQPSDDAPLPETAEPTAAGTAIRGTAPRAMGGFPSVVVLVPNDDSGEDFPIPAEPAVMDQYNTEFNPRLLLVRVGQKALFKNSEDTLHNVHVIDIETRDTEFNVATPVTGAFEHVFDHPAVYDVSCGIHPSMAAFIVVTDSPYAVVAGNDGTFSLDAVPAGSYVVTVWNLDPARRSTRIIDIDGDAIELMLDGMS